MEDFQQSRGAPAAVLSRKTPHGTAKSSYDDVFGGPPRYSGPFPPRPAEYGEMFGGLADSCSIPVLELPPVIDDGFEVVQRSNFDYFEIFGGLDNGDFAVSYEELFVESRGLENSAWNGRAPKETVLGHQAAVVPGFPSEEPNEDQVFCSEMDKSSSRAAALSKKDHFSSNEADHHFNDGAKQFNMSYHMSSQRSREAAVNGTTQITQVNAVPGFTSVVDTSVPLQNKKHANPPIVESNDISVKADSNGTIIEEKHFRKIVVPSPPSFTLMKSPGNELEAHQNLPDPKLTAFENAPTNEHHNLCSSSNPLTSSGDRSFPDLSTNNLNLSADFNGGITEGTQCRKIVPPIPSCNSMKSSGNDLKVDQKQSSINCTSSEGAPANEQRHSCSSSNHSAASGNRSFPDYSTNDLSPNADSDDGVPEGKHIRKDVSPASSYGSAESSGNHMNADQKKFTSVCTNLEDPSTNEKHGSLSFSYHSRSNWDRSYLGGTFLTVSDINLRTQSSRLPPPSRPPPKLARQGHPKMMMAANLKADLDERNLCRRVGNHKKSSSEGACDSHPLKESAMDGSLPFFDVEVDASSAAAASAAAIIEAMEQAEARLKSAKESMERKKDNLQNRKKLGLNEGIQSKERKENKKPHKEHRFNEEIIEKTSEEKVTPMKASDAEEWKNKTTREVQLTPELEEKERHPELTEESLQAMQGKETRSIQMPYGQNERAGEWKLEEQFYELIKNETKFKRVQEVSPEEGNNKKSAETTKICEEDQNEKKSAKATHKLKKNVKLLAVNEACEQKDRDCKLKEANVAGDEKEIKEISNMTLPAYVQEENENKLKEVLADCQREKNEKKLETQEVNDTLEEKNMRASEEAYLCEGSKKKVKAANEACECEEVFGSEEEERKPRASEEATNNYDPEVSGNKLKAVNRAFETDENEKEVIMNQVSCEEGMELRVALKVCEDDDLNRTVGSAKEVYCSEEKETKLTEAKVIIEQEESKKLDAIDENCKWVENEKQLEAAQEPCDQQENAEDTNAVQEALGYTENEKKMEEKTEACRRDSKVKLFKETCEDLQQNVKEQKVAEVPCELRNFEKLTADQGELEKREDENIKEFNIIPDFKENSNLFKDDQEVCDRTENEKESEDFQEANLLKEPAHMLKRTQEASEIQGTEGTGNKIPEVHKTEEKVKAERIERKREQEMERARKLEEDKEREREREKDRLAVERATREACERAFAEARERAERVAVERVTAEARQRALAEAREKAEKAAAEALEKSLAEKASRESRLRAERAAVERATAEARERAVERAITEKAAQDARERAARSTATSRERQRKDNEVEGYVRATSKEDSGMRRNSSFSDMHETVHYSQFPSSNYQRYSDSSNHASSSNGKTEELEGESAMRCKARLERHQRTFERAAKALAEKNLHDILAQREQAERNRLAETLDADVRRWSSGKEGNLRALLSTLQYILGPESGWQPIPLTDVITAAAVKKAYRKATLCVHPDKLQQRGASIQQKYMCEKVFDLLKEAWNRFNSEER